MKDNNILNYAPTNQANSGNVTAGKSKSSHAKSSKGSGTQDARKGKNTNQPAKNTKPSAPVKGKQSDATKPDSAKPSSKNAKTNTPATSKKGNPLTHKQRQGTLKVMFLGGVGEVGKNMTVFQYNDTIVILDSGIAFPSEDMPGVDVVIPDMSYIEANEHKVKALLLTHGHEDHIGAVPYLVKKMKHKLDIFGTKLTLGLLENKLHEHGLIDKVNFKIIADKSIVSLNEFRAEFIHVSHSVGGSVAVALRSPAGTVLHTGDFKIDYTPLGNEIMNINRMAEIGKEGVLLLMSESTNSEKPGYTMTETVVQDTMNKLFSDAKGRRIIIATFASNIDRLSMIIELARQYKRKIAVSGRSMIKYIETAQRVGYIKFDKSIFVDINRVGDMDDGKLVILATGSQGEPMSALTRMASGEFNKVNIGTNDTIILSSSPIPGNEKSIYNVINKLYRLGAVVIYSSLEKVHVSGHACQEELKLIYTLIRPKYFIPVHGEFRHLKQHSMLIEKLGHKRHDIIIPDIGDCIEVNNNTFKFGTPVANGSIMVDGLGVGDVGDIVLKDRLALAEDGIVVAVVGINTKTGTVVNGPEIISRGCFYFGDEKSQSTMEDIKKSVRAELGKCQLVNCNIATIKSAVQRNVKHYFRVNLKRNPVVLPVIMEM